MPYLKADFEREIDKNMFYDGTARALKYNKVELSDDKSVRSLKMVIDRAEHVGKIPHRSDLKILKGADKIPLETPIVYELVFTFSKRFVPDPHFAELAVQWLGDIRPRGGPVLSIAIRNNKLRLEHVDLPINQSEYPKVTRKAKMITPILGNIITYDQERWIWLKASIVWSAGENGSMNVQIRDYATGEYLADNYDLIGPNCDPTNYSPYLKFGPYKFDWEEGDQPIGHTEITRRVQYFRSVSVSW